MDRKTVIGRFIACSECESVLPGTARFFHRDRKRRTGLFSFCKTCAHEKRVDAYSKRRDSAVAYQRAYREANRLQILEYDRRYKVTHREQIRAYNAAHRSEVLARNRRRKARARGASGSHTAADIAAQRQRQRGRCFWCGGRLGDKWDADHVVPLLLGGSNSPENIVVSCVRCNRSKHAKHPMDWAGILL